MIPTRLAESSKVSPNKSLRPIPSASELSTPDRRTELRRIAVLARLLRSAEPDELKPILAEIKQRQEGGSDG